MNLIQTFTFNPFQENTYLVYNESKECVIIDPGCYTREEQGLLSAFIEKNGLKPIALLNTHCHLDHVFGNRFVFDTYGLKPYVHPEEMPIFNTVKQVAEMYGMVYEESPAPIHFEGDEWSIGTFSFKVLFVPGHSPGHIAFYSEQDKFLLAGDTLFEGSIGRTDLPGGDMDTLFASIRNKLFTLPEDTKVYAGHMNPTEIGIEKNTNPFFN